MEADKVWRIVSIFILLSFVLQQTLVAADNVRREGSGQLEFADSRASNEVTLSNNRIALTVSKLGSRGGSIRSLVYKRDGMQEDLELLQQTKSSSTIHQDERPGYWDMHWYSGSFISRNIVNRNRKCSFDKTNGASWTILSGNGRGSGDEMLGATFTHDKDSKKALPVNTDVHYSVKNDVAGVYCTLLVKHGPRDPAMLLTELRLVLRLNPKYFDYSYVADDRQKFMHTKRDLDRHFSSRLRFKEARLLTKPENVSQVGEVDHKYMHSVETKDSFLYGWISTSLNVGVWMISPNKWEYLGGGPTKQELSIQTGPKLLAMLHSRHYGTPAIDLQTAEEWRKVFGPFLVYVNEADTMADLIVDAKARAAAEEQAWPYKWVPFAEYKVRGERGTVIGRVRKQDSFAAAIDVTTISDMADTWVGLIDESSRTSNWEDEVKCYQFWNTTNDDGEFTLYNVLPGTYILHTVVRGLLTDTSVLQTVIVEENWVSNVGEIVVQPSQKGPIVWEIGYPDRSAAEFMIPPEVDPSAGTYTHRNSFRQYGLWEKYHELYPDRDPVFTVGKSDWTTDWYFAHVLRPNNKTTQREIDFTMEGPVVEGDYTLRLAIAGAHQAALEIRVNNPTGSPLYDTGAFGKDNALARAGVHGHYYEFSISLSHMNFRSGSNSIFLRQRKTESIFNHVMYDYLRLEAPANIKSL